MVKMQIKCNFTILPIFLKTFILLSLPRLSNVFCHALYRYIFKSQIFLQFLRLLQSSSKCNKKRID
jgi:hypothetical protein